MIAPCLPRPVTVLGPFAIAAGPTSTFVNLCHAEFSAETMVHGVFPGIVVDATLGGHDAIIPGGTVCAALVAAVLIVASRKPRHPEVMTVVLPTAFFSLGTVIPLRIGGMSGRLESPIFGWLLDITLSHTRTSTVVLTLAVALPTLTWRAQVAVASDREVSCVSGIPVTWIDIAFNAMLGTIVAAASTAVDVLLVVGYLTMSSAFGCLLATGPRLTVLLAGTCALVGGWAGLGASLLHASRSLSL